MKSIALRLQESVYENAKFTKRLFHEMTRLKDVETAHQPAQQLMCIRDVFSVHIVLCFFTREDRFKVEGNLN